MPLSIGQLIENGRYRIDALLGQGGMGAVYRATDMRLGITVAIKENLDPTPEAQRQFGREARILAGLSHQNLPRVTDFFVIPGQGQYLVMNFVEGEDLQTMLNRVGVLPEHLVLNWVAQVCSALAYLHNQPSPVIHRDIKPANIKICPDGRAMLVDFGIAKLYDAYMATTIGAKAVTPGYSPPEQYGGGRTDARSDIYALGATLYHLLTGQVPPESVQRAAGSAKMPLPRDLNPQISRTTEQAVVKAVEVSAEHRFQNVGELSSALAQRGYYAPPQPAVSATPAPRARPSVQRTTGPSPVLLAGAAVAVVATVALIVMALSTRPRTASITPTAIPAPTRMPTAKPVVVEPTTPPPTAAPTAKPVEKVMISYWEQEGDTIDSGILDPLAAEFTAANPDITVERTHYGTEELRMQFQTASLAGAAPDLFRGPNDAIGVFADEGIVLPVKDIFDPGFLDTFLPGALAGGVRKGVMYAVPDTCGNHLMLLYNKVLVTRVPADWDELIATAQSLTDEAAGTWGLAYNTEEPFWLVPFLGGFGGWVLDPATDAPTLGTPQMVNALQFMADLSLKYKIVPPGCDYNTADALFKDGRAAFLINGDWSLSGYQGVVDFGTAAMPRIKETGLYPTPMTSGKYWVISSQVQKGTLKFEAVRKFVEFMAGEHAQTVWLRDNWQLPSNKKVASSSTIQSDPILRGSMAQLAHGVAMPTAPELSCFWDIARPGQQGVIAGTDAAADAAAKMQEDADRCIRDMGLSPSS